MKIIRGLYNDTDFKINKMTRLTLLILLSILISTSPIMAKTYFVSPNGSDNSSGLSIEEAWKSLKKVNSHTYQPGDNILFQKNGVWHGQLLPNGSGEKGLPIRVSSYGKGERPIINMGDAEGAVIRLTNQSWWIIENIELTSGAFPKVGIDRQGIAVIVKGKHPMDLHLIVQNCYIHDIWGQMTYNSAAILIRTELRKSRLQPNYTSFDYVLIEGNRIERIDRCGIIIRGGKNHIVVRENYLEDLGGGGIFLNGAYAGLIEYNIVKRSCLRTGNIDMQGSNRFWPNSVAIWIQGCDKTIIQYNEVYNTGRDTRNNDGQAFDFDYYTTNSIIQYNYSKNNNGGFLLLMGDVFGNIVRYNISENDQFQIIRINSNMELTQNYIYNNVFYKNDGLGTISISGSNQKKVNTSGAYFRNNVFYATGQGQFQLAYATGSAPNIIFHTDIAPTKRSQSPLFLNNAYYGTWKTGVPKDRKKIVMKPLFVAPGTGKHGYELKYNSPLINAGFFFPFANKDFYGNLIEDGKSDIGVFEQTISDIFINKDKRKALKNKRMVFLRLKEAKWAIKKARISKEQDGIVFSPIKTISKEIYGTIMLVNKNSEIVLDKVNLNNLTERKHFNFKIKTDSESIHNTLLVVNLRDEKETLKFKIPLWWFKFSTGES